MIPLELRARIRRLHFAEHWPVGTIAAELGVHHETVQRALDADWVRSGAGRTNKASILAPYRDFIVQTLEEHPRLTASRLFEMVTARGYEGGIAQVRRFVRTARPRKSEAFLRLNTLPGEQGQVDWGLFGKLKVGNAERALCCFVMVLSWSRAVYARFFLDMTMESFMRGHVRAFEALGGVPRELLYDNLKSAVLERAGDAIRFHPRLLELSGHYHFAPKPCAPYRGNEKGRVERTIRDLRISSSPPGGTHRWQISMDSSSAGSRRSPTRARCPATRSAGSSVMPGSRSGRASFLCPSTRSTPSGWNRPAPERRPTSVSTAMTIPSPTGSSASP